MKIVNYLQKYEHEVIDLWNNAMKADFIDVKNFRKKIIFDDNFNQNLAFVALDDNEKVIGFIYGYKRKYPYLDKGLEPKKGWIGAIFVDEKFRHRGLGRELLSKVENELISLGAKTIIVGANSPNYLFPGVDLAAYKDGKRFFENNSYINAGEAVSMSRELWDYSFPEKIKIKEDEFLKENIVIRRFEYKYGLELLECAGKYFGGGWKRSLLIHMQNSDAENKIWICTKNEEVIGFCTRSLDGSSTRFGPFGVKEEYRSKGIGAILFHHMLKDLKEKGYYQIYFLWTDGDAIRFYERNGLKIVRKYELMRKDV